MDIEKIREKIDRLDNGLVELLEQRIALAKNLKGMKKPIYDPKREKEIIKRIQEMAREFPAKDLERIYGLIFSASKKAQGNFNVCFLGPEGSYSHRAMTGMFGDIQGIGKNTITEVFEEVEEKSSYGIVPVENTTHGTITETIEELARKNVFIVNEIVIDIEHCLVAGKGTKESEIRTVYVQPNIRNQCRKFLNAISGKGVKLVESSSSSEKCRSLKQGEAVIAGRQAAELYGLRIIERGINDFSNNRTRFLAIHDSMLKKGSKHSLIFTLAHKPGTLLKALGAITEANANMTKIESRIMANADFEYTFFVDFVYEGDATRILDKIRDNCISMKYLGRY